MIKFTIFTPAYNRAHTLRRCYESILAQDNLEELLGEYLYGLLKFLGKLLYIYDLLNDDVRDIQYISITKDGETIDNVLDLVYNPVKDTYKEYIKRLRYNAESEDQQDEFSIDYDEYE